jgi:hypothetical protein
MARLRGEELQSRSESECDKRVKSSGLDTKPSDLSMARLKQW